MMMPDLQYTLPAVQSDVCALPAGVLECLVRLHEWPHGLRSSREWLHEVTMLMADITEQHGNDACDRGISPEEHIRNISAVPG